MKKTIPKIFLILFCFLSFSFQGQERDVSGVVSDKDNTPIPGVTVQEKGTANGTVTDFDGGFSLSVSDNSNTILVFSFMGYKAEEIAIETRSTFEIVMEEDSESLDEVVVVGYGTQTKKDLTGSISTINGDDITERSVSNVSNALQGAIPGVSVTRGGSAPGSSSSVQIRGVTTLEGSSSPLILVDDIPVRSIDDVNPNDIESISVLKDGASAAIYGSRGAAGVIIITTKRAKSGAFSINYSGEQIINTPTEMRSTVGAIRYMEMHNEYMWNDTGNGADEFPIYTEEKINNYIANNAENPDQYPITDWADLIINDYSFGSRHNLTLSGGSEKVKTRVNLGYDEQNALYDHRKWKRYTAKINNNIDFNNKFGAIVDATFRIAESDQPSVDPTSDALSYAPIYAATWEDGRIASGEKGQNVYAELHNGGFSSSKAYEFFGKIGVFYKPIKDLKISLNISPRFDFRRNKAFNKTIPYWDYDDPQRTGSTNYIVGHNDKSTILKESRRFYQSLTTQALINYDTSFDGHKISGVLGFEEFSSENENLLVEGREYEVTEYPFLSQAPVDKVFDNGTNLSELAYSSYFGRLEYNYKDRYYLQGNFRRDASSRFGSEYRWGTFPSVSLGWAISNEKFFESLKPTISFLKLRASYGELGNDRLGNYLYLSTLQFETALFANGENIESLRTAAQRYLAIKDITWETTTTYNLGFDASLFKDRLFIKGDYYKKETEDMLLSLSIPDFSGYADPKDNVGTMNTTGWELEASWRDNIGELNYSASFNIFDSKSIIGDIAGKRIVGGRTISEEGTEYNAWYGYKSDGIYQTPEEIANSATTSANLKPGDVRYKDISGPDGEPDGKINELDKTLLGGSPLPRYQYGGNISLDYKGFDLSMTFQGVGKRKVYLGAYWVKPFENSWRSPPSLLEGNYWSVYNTATENENARYPRLSGNSVGNNYAVSDFQLINGSYFRVKNLTLGFTLPINATENIGISKLRIYLAGNDLFTFDNFPEGIDPEDSGGYLITKSYLLGVNVKL